MSEWIAAAALLLSIATIVYGAGSYGQRIKTLEAYGPKEIADLRVALDKEIADRERLRDRVDTLATKDDLRDMEARIESRIDDLKAALGGRHG